MQFKDYLKYFSQTHLCFMYEQGNYLFDDFLPSPKRGTYWNVQVFREGEYCLELHQNGSRGEEQDDSKLARGTLVVTRNLQPKGSEFIGGTMSHYRQDCSMRLRLSPGRYTVFGKFDCNGSQELPFESSFSLYSLDYVVIERADPLKAKGMLRESLLLHARGNKRRRYEDDTMWISWKLLYK